MTRKYWVGICAVMLAIFVVGMLAARGVDRVKTLFHDNYPAAIGLLTDANFRVDNHHLGDVERLQLMRATPGTVDSVVFTVRVDSTDEDVQALTGSTCRLRITGATPIGSHTRFACTSDRDSARLELVRFGHVKLMPQGTDVALYVSGSTVSEVQANAYHGVGSNDSGLVEIVGANDTFSITINGQQIVNLDGKHGSVSIHGGNGKSLVEIHGDDKGGSVKVNDANGKSIVNIHGSSNRDSSSH